MNRMFISESEIEKKLIKIRKKINKVNNLLVYFFLIYEWK